MERPTQNVWKDNQVCFPRLHTRPSKAPHKTNEYIVKCVAKDPIKDQWKNNQVCCPRPHTRQMWWVLAIIMTFMIQSCTKRRNKSTQKTSSINSPWQWNFIFT
jgi:hypothetical protein